MKASLPLLWVMYRSRPYSVCGSASYSWKCIRLKMRNEMRCVVKMHTVEDAKWDAIRRLSIFVTVREKMVCMVSHMKATSTLLHCTPIVPILCKCGNSSTEIRKWNKKCKGKKKDTYIYTCIILYVFKQRSKNMRTAILGIDRQAQHTIRTSTISPRVAPVILT